MGEDFLNWLLPINCNWFILLIGGSAVLTVILCVMTYCQQADNGRRYMFRSMGLGFLALLSMMALISSISWCIYANNLSPEVASKEKLEIKLVTYPNGQTVQMFHSNGTNYNVNQMYSCVAPEGSHIERVSYKRVYAGVYFSPSTQGRDGFSDQFFLVRPDKSEKKADKVSPAD